MHPLELITVFKIEFETLSSVLISQPQYARTFSTGLPRESKVQFSSLSVQFRTQVIEPRSFRADKALQNKNKRSEDQVFARHSHLPHRETAFEG